MNLSECDGGVLSLRLPAFGLRFSPLQHTGETPAHSIQPNRAVAAEWSVGAPWGSWGGAVMDTWACPWPFPAPSPAAAPQPCPELGAAATVPVTRPPHVPAQGAARKVTSGKILAKAAISLARCLQALWTSEMCQESSVGALTINRARNCCCAPGYLATPERYT